MMQSLSRPRQCRGNAVAESFFASLKLECIYRESWATRTQVRRAVFDYIEVFYNRRRLHSAIGYCPPAEHEAKLHHHTTAEAAQPRCPANRVRPTSALTPSVGQQRSPTNGLRASIGHGLGTDWARRPRARAPTVDN